MTTPGVQLTEAELREGLTACLPVPRWVDEVAVAAPFGSMLELLDVGAAAANPLTAAEVDAAVADLPQVEEVADPGEDPGLAQALADGRRAYEERFGRPFWVRSAGRSRAAVLAELRRRLDLDADTELATVAGELRDVALLRIPQLFAHLDHHSGFDDGEAAQ